MIRLSTKTVKIKSTSLLINKYSSGDDYDISTEDDIAIEILKKMIMKVVVKGSTSHFSMYVKIYFLLSACMIAPDLYSQYSKQTISPPFLDTDVYIPI